MTNFPQQIETERLILRQPCMELAEALLPYRCRYQSEEGLQKVFSSKENIKDSIRKHTEGYYGNIVRYYTFLKGRPQRVIGDIEVASLEVGTEISWDTDADYENNGYATEASLAVLQVVKELGYPNIHALITDKNEASQAVAQKLGMIHCCNSNIYLYRPLNTEGNPTNPTIH